MLESDPVVTKLDFDNLPQEEEQINTATDLELVDQPPKIDVPKVLRSTPQPFVILQNHEETYSDIIDTDGIILSTSFLECSYCQS